MNIHCTGHDENYVECLIKKYCTFYRTNVLNVQGYNFVNGFKSFNSKSGCDQYQERIFKLQ
jgi:hypothetical protein